MSEYTPTRNEMLTALVIYRATQREKPPRIEDLATPEQAKRYLGEAERGLAEVERAAAARALEEAAQSYPFTLMGVGATWHEAQKVLCARAEAYRREETE